MVVRHASKKFNYRINQELILYCNMDGITWVKCVDWAPEFHLRKKKKPLPYVLFTRFPM